jgi:hypothetical protein
MPSTSQRTFSSLVLVSGGPAALLELAALTFARQPLLVRRARRFRRTARLLHTQRLFDPCPQPLERELAVAQLAPGVLRARGDPRTEARTQTRPLTFGERSAVGKHDARLDTRGGDVRVLTARTGGPARADFNFVDRDCETRLYAEIVGQNTQKTGGIEGFNRGGSKVEMGKVLVIRRLSQLSRDFCASLRTDTVSDEKAA